MLANPTHLLSPTLLPPLVPSQTLTSISPIPLLSSPSLPPFPVFPLCIVHFIPPSVPPPFPSQTLTSHCIASSPIPLLSSPNLLVFPLDIVRFIPPSVPPLPPMSLPFSSPISHALSINPLPLSFFSPPHSFHLSPSLHVPSLPPSSPTHLDHC